MRLKSLFPVYVHVEFLGKALEPFCFRTKGLKSGFFSDTGLSLGSVGRARRGRDGREIVLPTKKYVQAVDTLVHEVKHLVIDE